MTKVKNMTATAIVVPQAWCFCATLSGVLAVALPARIKVEKMLHTHESKKFLSRSKRNE